MLNFVSCENNNLILKNAKSNTKFKIKLIEYVYCFLKLSKKFIFKYLWGDPNIFYPVLAPAKGGKPGLTL
jgi:hypothetical protein